MKLVLAGRFGHIREPIAPPRYSRGGRPLTDLPRYETAEYLIEAPRELSIARQEAAGVVEVQTAHYLLQGRVDPRPVETNSRRIAEVNATRGKHRHAGYHAGTK